MDANRYLLILIGMACATYVSRYPILYLAGKRDLPSWLRFALNYVPPAVLISIAAPAVLVQDNKLALSLSNEYFVASVITATVAWCTKHMLISILTGMLALWGWRILTPLFPL